MWIKVLVASCVLLVLLLQLGDGQVPTNRPSNGVQLYLAYENRIIPDFSMIHAGQFYASDNNHDNISDALWCQSANTGSDIGLWYYPNGTQVPLFTKNLDQYGGTSPIFSKRFTGQIALAKIASISGYEGLYTCIIPDENGVNQTLVVGIYTTHNYNINNVGPNADSSMKFSLISTRDTNPPDFTLIFNVSNGPPTNVICTDGSNPFTIGSSDLVRVVVNGPGSVTQVTVTVRMRQAGTYQCTVSNAKGSSSTSQPITIAGTPTGLTVTRLNTGLAHVQLSWSSVSGVAGYEVFYQLSSGSSSVMSAGTTNNTMLNITSGLTYKTNSLINSYNFFVVSYGSEGSTVLPSNHSNTITVTFSIPFPTLTFNITNTTITMMWSQPSFAPQRYEGYCQCRRLCEKTYDLSLSVDSSPYIFTGIDPGSECTIGLNGIYGSEPAGLGLGIITTLSSAPTSSVSNIIISSVEATSMTLSWDEVPCSGQNGPITGYLLYYTNTTFSDTVNITGGDNRQYNLTTLTPYTNYTVTIRAYNDAGTGPASSKVIQQTGEAAPTLSVSSITISSVKARSMTISWDEVPSFGQNGPITGYLLYYTNTTFSDTVNITGGDNRQYTLTTLRPYTNYTVTVRAYNKGGTGPASSKVIQQTREAAPTSSVSSITISSVKARSMTISWDEVPSFGQNGPITGYLLYYANTTFNNTVNITGGHNRQYNLTTLTPYTSYTVTVIAYNDAGTGPASSEVIQQTGEAAPTSSVSNITISSVEATSMTISWDEVLSSGQNGPITGYLLYYTNTTFNDTVNITGGDNRQYNLTTLTPYVNYTVTIRAYNDAGTGPASSKVIQQTEEAKPGMVSGLIQSDIEIQVINITWNIPTVPNGVIIMYEIRYRESNNIGPYNMTNTTNTQYSIGGLLPNTNYIIGVRAYTSVGPGEWNDSQISTSNIPIVSGFNITKISSTAVLVMWQPITAQDVKHYTVYYISTSKRKRQSDMGKKTFPAGSSEGVIGGLQDNLNYLFSISVTYEINGVDYEGERTQPIPPGVTLTPTPTVMSSSISISSTTTPSTSDGTSSGGSNTAAIAAGIIVALIIVTIIIAITIVVIIVMKKLRQSLKFSGDNNIIPVSYTKDKDTGYGEVKVPTTRREPPPAPAKPAPKPPVIDEFPSTISVEEGHKVEFTVRVTGTPPLTFNWYHDGELVTEDYAHEITEDGSLIIFTAEESHKGTYRFVANNSAGTVDQQVILVIAKEGTNEAKALYENAKLQANIEPIPVKDFGVFVADSHANSNDKFRLQYNSLESGENEHPVTVAVTPTNKPLNRFANITVYDDNRIILNPIPGQQDCQNDYINASYLDGYAREHQYIATQGPISKTLVDFWRLIWQEKPPTIVMVTNLKEDKKIKCQQYWPDSGSKDFGPFQVTLLEQQIFTDYIIRNLQVVLSDSSLQLIQYHFTSWPDHGVPDYATSILTFHKRIRKEYHPKRGPMLVHCSAGVGRTGTFITIDMVLQQAEQEGHINIMDIINQLRHKRMKMVQTPAQYIFINDAILESITCGDTQIDTANVRTTVHKMANTDPSTRQNGFEHQFQVLEQVTPRPDEIMRDIALQNQDKNRTNEFLPSDKHRVPLKGEHPDYINAVYVNGYKQKKAFIIAEGPMENTCHNFWKMVTDRKTSAIVMLGHLRENKKEVCYQYWPSTETIVVGEYNIQLQNETEYDGYNERTILVKNNESGVKQTVTQYQITNWDANGHMKNIQTILTVLEDVYKVQRKMGNTPIIVHCSDTVTRSGMFCAIATTIDRCNTERIVDVFQVLKAQRIQKPGSVLTVEQYQGIFNAVIVYLDSFETYANFT